MTGFPLLASENGREGVCPASRQVARMKALSLLESFNEIRCPRPRSPRCSPSLLLIAALTVGAQAPDFTTQAALGGKQFNFALKSALRKGPVVLYFFPAAFTKGCTIEAHEFALAASEFKKNGATLIGLSADLIEGRRFLQGRMPRGLPGRRG